MVTMSMLQDTLHIKILKRVGQITRRGEAHIVYLETFTVLLDRRFLRKLRC